MNVTIGIDPHKATHTAVAIDRDETELATITVRATRRQTERLLGWAEPFEQRTWAIESAGGLGYLLAQQLVDAGEHVLDVPATLASRVRVLGTGKSDKNDPNDARSVAIAALRAPGLRAVQAADHAEVLRLMAKRNQDIGAVDAGRAHPPPGRPRAPRGRPTTRLPAEGVPPTDQERGPGLGHLPHRGLWRWPGARLCPHRLHRRRSQIRES